MHDYSDLTSSTQIEEMRLEVLEKFSSIFNLFSRAQVFRENAKNLINEMLQDIISLSSKDASEKRNYYSRLQKTFDLLYQEQDTDSIKMESFVKKTIPIFNTMA